MNGTDFSGWYGTTYAPAINFNVDPGSTDPKDIAAALSKRPKFREETAQYFKDNMAAGKGVDPLGKEYIQGQCLSCGQLGAMENMHLGHILAWKGYIESKVPLCVGAVIAAYNDIGNLKLEHALCNSSHIFEGYENLVTTGWGGLTPDQASQLRDKLQRSGLFDFATDPTATPSAPEIYAALKVRREGNWDDPDIGLADTPIVSGGRTVAIQLGTPIVNHRIEDEVVIADMDRPAFDKSTLSALSKKWAATPRYTGRNAAGEKFLFCESCENLGEASTMQLGHRDPWKQHITNTVGYPNAAGQIVCKQKDAQWVYNDLKNLKFEHMMCNLGHEWEEELDKTAFPDDPAIAAIAYAAMEAIIQGTTTEPPAFTDIQVALPGGQLLTITAFELDAAFQAFLMCGDDTQTPVAQVTFGGVPFATYHAFAMVLEVQASDDVDEGELHSDFAELAEAAGWAGLTEADFAGGGLEEAHYAGAGLMGETLDAGQFDSGGAAAAAAIPVTPPPTSLAGPPPVDARPRVAPLVTTDNTPGKYEAQFADPANVVSQRDLLAADRYGELQKMVSQIGVLCARMSELTRVGAELESGAAHLQAAADTQSAAGLDSSAARAQIQEITQKLDPIYAELASIRAQLPVMLEQESAMAAQLGLASAFPFGQALNPAAAGQFFADHVDDG